MRRRTFLLTGIVVLADATAQTRRTPRIGVTLAQPIPNAFQRAFQEGLRQLGYVEGKNIHVEYRSAHGRAEPYPRLFRELIALRPDVIVAGGGGVALTAALQATSTIPIVCPASSDPVSGGHAKSLARPGGNYTGLSILESETAAKRIDFLRELLPRAKRVAVLQEGGATPELQRVFAVQLEWTRAAAARTGFELQPLTGKTPEEYEGAFRAAHAAGAEALLVLPSASFAANRKQLVELAAKYRLITMWENRVFTDVGGLVSYGPDVADMYRRAAAYVDKILKGARPADLPIEQASKFDLVVNLKTAAALGVSVPRSLLLRADEIIE